MPNVACKIRDLSATVPLDGVVIPKFNVSNVNTVELYLVSLSNRL